MLLLLFYEMFAFRKLRTVTWADPEHNQGGLDFQFIKLSTFSCLYKSTMVSIAIRDIILKPHKSTVFFCPDFNLFIKMFDQKLFISKF